MRTQILLLLAPVQQKKLKFEEEVKSDLSDVKQCLQRLEKRSMVEDEIKRAFECTICKQVARQPVISGCCQRLVGCKNCLDMWLAHSPVCRLCKGNSIITAKVELKGFNDLLALFPQGTSENRTQALSASQGREADDDDFESSPPF